MFTLIYSESGEPKRYPLPAGDTVVGRAVTCDVVINDPSISRWHARFAVSCDACAVCDVGSSNGTLRNGEQITTDTPVADGDVLVLGRLPVRVEQSAADRLSFSEDHPVLDLPGTIVRPITQTILPATKVAAVADADRLLRLMSDVARTLVRSQPLSDVLEQVVDLAFGTIPAERAFLILTDQSTGTLVPRVVRCRGQSEAGSTSISRTIVNQVLADRVAILAYDAQMETKFRAADSVQAQAIRSFMCAPLWNQNEVIGVLYVDTPRSQRFSAPDLDLFTAISNYAAVAIEQARLAARLLEETRRRERLQRYHSPAVVDRILESGDEAEAPFIAQERDVTVLFADIVGFTGLAEGLRPAEVAQLLNTYLGCMSDVIFDYEGTLDKFIGDAILVVFGAPLDQPDHAVRAVRTAQQMRRAVGRLNALRERPLEIRIAIHSGLALAGDMGSPTRREYTVLGDVVNTASRLESIIGPGEIVISRATYERLNGQVEARSRGSIGLRGRIAEVEIFDVDE
jgi:adenylate cyclase